MTLTNHPTLPGQRILLLGANGFIGQRLARRLLSQGHQVTFAGRNARNNHTVIDFAHMLSAKQWLPLLRNIDVIVNAIGMLRGSRGNSLKAVHELAPIALFDACSQAGIQRVVQISALGVDGNETEYARTKRAADAHLLSLTRNGTMQALVVRPSLVFGKGGASTQLFFNLARLPVLMLPSPMLTNKVQPIAADDLADAVMQLLNQSASGIVELGGPQPLTMAALVASLRKQMGLRPAIVTRLPEWLTQASARCGDAVAASPWCSASLELASHDNCCDPLTAAHWIGRATLAPDQLLASLGGQ